jgi:hypothetical protein
MKLYTEQQVKKLLDAQKGNCYVAVLNETKDEKVSVIAGSAPYPGGDQFDKLYGIDPEQLLIEDLADNELSLRYERFKKDLAYAKEKYNELVPIINERIKLIDTLKESIVGLASQNVSTSNVVTDLKTIVDELNQYKEAADSLMSQINENKKLIKDYEDWSERKLFMHWKYLTHFKVVKEDWITWKFQHKGVIL